MGLVQGVYGERPRGLSVLHRIKAIESYEALELMMDEGLTILGQEFSLL